MLAPGPRANLALALQRDPAFAVLAREIVILGGSLNPRAANNEFGLECPGSGATRAAR